MSGDELDDVTGRIGEVDRVGIPGFEVNDLIVVNGPEAIDSPATSLEVLDPQGAVLAAIRGEKPEAARELLAVIAELLIDCRES